MSRGKKLGILTGILAVVILATVLTAQIVQRKEAEEATANVETVAAISADDVTELSWSYNGEQMHFVRQEDTWINGEDESFPADTDLLDNMVASLTEIASSKTISGTAERSEFGLDPAVVDLTVTADGEYHLLLGNESPIDGSVYACLDDGQVFLTDSILRSQFSRDLLDLVEKESTPTMDSIQSVEIRRDQGTLHLEYDDSSSRSWDESYVWFAEEGGNTVTLDTDKVQGLLQTIKYLQWTDTAAYHVDSSKLAEYGLDDPAAAVTVSYTDENGDDGTFLVDIGSENEDGTCYGMIHGSDRIYRTDSTVYDSLAETGIEDLLPNDVLKMDWDTVKSMKMILEDTVYAMTRNTKEDTVDKASEKETSWEWTYEENTLDLTEALNSLAALSAEEMDPETAEGDSVFALLMERNTANYPQMELTIWELDEDYYGITVNGEHRLKILKETMDPVIQQFRDAVK